MNIFKFVKNAGEKISDFITGDGRAEDAITARIHALGLKIENLGVAVDGERAVLTGQAPSRDAYEKAILAAGNIKGIESVESKMSVAENASAAPQPAAQPQTQGNAAPAPAQTATAPSAMPEPVFYRVKSGDTLSKISKQFYGDANQYQRIFEANRPMLKSPDAIYPDQTLRIPDAPEEKRKAA